MAIVIHAKNIYDKINDKVINNQINKVNYSENSIDTQVDYNTLLTTMTYDLTGDTSWLDNGVNYNGKRVRTRTSAGIGEKTVVYLKTFYVIKNIKIDKYSNNKLYEILKIYSGLNDSSKPYIKYTVSYKKRQATIDFLPGITSPFYYPDNIDGFSFVFNEGTIEESDISNSYTYNIYPFEKSEIIATTDDNVGTATFSLVNDVFSITLALRVGREYCGIGGLQGPGDSIYASNEKAEAYYEEPLSVSVSFYGDEKKLEPQSENKSVGVGNQDMPFTLSSNELMQDTTKIGSQTMSSYLSDKILLNYKNGKETAELRCSINDYYDENGTLAISPKLDKMTFAIGDEVIPYIMTTQGEKPMSSYKIENVPKKFIITATEIYFDGAVWQKLTLQEKRLQKWYTDWEGSASVTTVNNYAASISRAVIRKSQYNNLELEPNKTRVTVTSPTNGTFILNNVYNTIIYSDNTNDYRMMIETLGIACDVKNKFGEKADEVFFKITKIERLR